MNTKLRILTAAIALSLGLGLAGNAMAQASGPHTKMRILEPGASGTLYLGTIHVTPADAERVGYLGTITVTPTGGRYAANGQVPHSAYLGAIHVTADARRVAANDVAVPRTAYLGRITVTAKQTVAVRDSTRSTVHNIITLIRSLVFAR